MQPTSTQRAAGLRVADCRPGQDANSPDELKKVQSSIGNNAKIIYRAAGIAHGVSLVAVASRP